MDSNFLATPPESSQQCADTEAPEQTDQSPEYPSPNEAFRTAEKSERKKQDMAQHPGKPARYPGVKSYDVGNGEM